MNFGRLLSVTAIRPSIDTIVASGTHTSRYLKYYLNEINFVYTKVVRYSAVVLPIKMPLDLGIKLSMPAPIRNLLADLNNGMSLRPLRRIN